MSTIVAALLDASASGGVFALAVFLFTRTPSRINNCRTGQPAVVPQMTAAGPAPTVTVDLVQRTWSATRAAVAATNQGV